ncbi:MAG: type II toxin-antitoxin system HicA family toxin [Chitinophagaceae bacterium]
MRLPRDISSKELIKLLKKFGYQITRQKGSHIRVTTTQQGEHHITVPNHDPIRLGTLSSIISAVANHFKKTKEEIAAEIF